MRFYNIFVKHYDRFKYGIYRRGSIDFLESWAYSAWIYSLTLGTIRSSNQQGLLEPNYLHIKDAIADLEQAELLAAPALKGSILQELGYARGCLHADAITSTIAQTATEKAESWVGIVSAITYRRCMTGG